MRCIEIERKGKVVPEFCDLWNRKNTVSD